MENNPAQATTPPTSGTGWYLTVAVIVMLVAAFLRIYGLSDTLGLSDGEIVSVRLAERLFEGDIRLIYDNVTPAREGIYYAFLAVMNGIYGDGLMLWRLPSVWVSLVTIAITLRLMREFFGVRAGLLVAGLLAGVFWSVWLGRAVTHVTLLPLMAALTFFVFARAYRALTITQSSLWFTLGALLLGFTLYTHVTAWTVPVILALFVLYRLFLRPPEFIYHWGNIAYAAIVTFIMSVPLILYLFNNPGAREPVPLGEQPDLIAALPARLLATASALVLRGDQLPVHNLPGRPVMDVALFGLAVLGVGVALARVRRPEYAFVLIWTAVGLIPTALLPTTDFEFMAVVLPVLFVFPAIGLRTLYQVSLEFIKSESWHTAADFTSGMVALALVAITAVVTFEVYFQQWANLPAVEEAYHTEIARVAIYIDGTTDTIPISVCDIPTADPLVPSNEDFLRIMLHRTDINVRYFDCRTALVIAEGGRNQRLVFPGSTYTELTPGALLHWMTYAEPIEVNGLAAGTVVQFEVEDALTSLPAGGVAWPLLTQSPREATLPLTFDGGVALLGYEVRDTMITPAQPLEVVTYWHFDEPPPEDLRIVAQVLSNPLVAVAELEAFSAQVASLQPGDVLVQYHPIPTPQDILAGRYPLAVALIVNGEHLTVRVNEQATSVILDGVEVIR